MLADYLRDDGGGERIGRPQGNPNPLGPDPYGPDPNGQNGPWHTTGGGTGPLPPSPDLLTRMGRRPGGRPGPEGGGGPSGPGSGGPGPGGGPGGGSGGGPGVPVPGVPVFPEYPINPYPGNPNPVPGFTPPPGFEPPKFGAPDPNQLLNDPAYQFRLNQGNKALNASAAARGVLHTGGTLQDIVGYGQDYASQEYQNAYNRALQTHEQDYRGAHDKYNADYKGAFDKHATEYDAWALKSGQDFGAWETWLQAQLARMGLLNEATALGMK